MYEKERENIKFHEQCLRLFFLYACLSALVSKCWLNTDFPQYKLVHNKLFQCALHNKNIHHRFIHI